MKNTADIKKTNAMRILENLGIAYEVRTYAWDEDHIDALHAAENLGIDPQEVYKTIILRNQDNLLFVFCVPAPCEISLKKARTVTGSRSIDLIRSDELRPLTGYVRGGCSPLGMIHPYPTFLEETVQLLPRVSVSAGLRGVQLLLSPLDLARAAAAVFADIV